MTLFGGWRLTRTGVLFVVGILVLAGLVTGGIFLVKNHGEAVRRDEAVKVAEKNLEEQSKVATQPVNTDQGKTPVKTTESATPATTNTTPTTPLSTSSTKLPQTGPDDVQAIERVIIVAALALSVSFYVASRRAARTL